MNIRLVLCSLLQNKLSKCSCSCFPVASLPVFQYLRILTIWQFTLYFLEGTSKNTLYLDNGGFCFLGNDTYISNISITSTHVQWGVPHVKLNDDSSMRQRSRRGSASNISYIRAVERIGWFIACPSYIRPWYYQSDAAGIRQFAIYLSFKSGR